MAHGEQSLISSLNEGILTGLSAIPQQLMLVTLGLLLGRHNLGQDKKFALTFCIAVVAGGIIASYFPASNLELVVLTTTAVMSLLLAATSRLPASFCMLLAIWGGAVAGSTLPALIQAGHTQLSYKVGVVLGLILPIVYATLIAAFFNKRVWQQIGVRVIGSWITAVCCMMGALAVKNLY